MAGSDHVERERGCREKPTVVNCWLTTAEDSSVVDAKNEGAT